MVDDRAAASQAVARAAPHDLLNSSRGPRRRLQGYRGFTRPGHNVRL